MAIFHCSIKIINRAGGRSAVASAAYRSGEKLHNKETGLIHDFTKKGGVVMNEILLPVNAPEKYMNREVLWNEVQEIEKRSDAQFAREVEVALPNEMTRQQQIDCVRSYIHENFTDKGMIADWALHDKGDGNPHAHIMLTVREFDDNKQWKQKQKTVFANALDENGKAIYNPDLPSYDFKRKEQTSQYRIPKLDEDGKQKVRVRQGKGTEYLWEKITIPSNDWNDRKNAEAWRASWAKHCNRYLEKDQQIDHRSYIRQGINLEPTIHEGVTARKIRKRGEESERCQINEEIRERNNVRIKIQQEMLKLANELTALIMEKAREVYDRFKQFGKNSGYVEPAGEDARHLGKTRKRHRKGSNSDNEPGRTTGRIAQFKRTIEHSCGDTKTTDQTINGTEHAITETNQYIKRLTEAIKRKEADRDERLRKIKERRSASRPARTDADTDRRFTGSEYGPGDLSSRREKEKLRESKGDIRAFLRKLDSEERTSEEKLNHSISERNDREISRKRLDLERKRETEEPKRISPEKSGIRSRRSREIDFER